MNWTFCFLEYKNCRLSVHKVVLSAHCLNLVIENVDEKKMAKYIAYLSLLQYRYNIACVI